MPKTLGAGPGLGMVLMVHKLGSRNLQDEQFGISSGFSATTSNHRTRGHGCHAKNRIESGGPNCAVRICPSAFSGGLACFCARRRSARDCFVSLQTETEQSGRCPTLIGTPLSFVLCTARMIGSPKSPAGKNISNRRSEEDMRSPQQNNVARFV